MIADNNPIINAPTQLAGRRIALIAPAAALTLDASSILVLEDVGEAEFRLERCFHQLLGSIDCSQLVAVCLGCFERCALADGFDNHAWPYGCVARIESSRLSWPAA